VSKPSLPPWGLTLAVRFLLLAVLVDVLVGTGAFLYRWGPSVFTMLVGPHPGPQALATAVITKAALLAPVCRRRIWAVMSLAVAYLLSERLFLAFAGMLHLDWLLSSVLYWQAQVAAMLAAGLLLVSWSDAKEIENPRRRRILRGTAAVGFALALIAQLALFTTSSSGFASFPLVMLLWNLVLPAAALGLSIGLFVVWWRRRHARGCAPERS